MAQVEILQFIYYVKCVAKTLTTIGEMFNIKAYSTVSGIIRRIPRVIKNNRKIKKQIGKIQDSINMGL
ncbi:MAG: hypothetical protein B1H11_07605 [Desulfobacteraceae bacterium 4484_190.1]|nr:MAG: hypothetical protein B1H11_07605 [Desulfobacteraceae bacterium 4484_190.1]